MSSVAFIYEQKFDKIITYIKSITREDKNMYDSGRTNNSKLVAKK